VESFVAIASTVREFVGARLPDLPDNVGTASDARQVAPCAERFACGELDPSGRLATARHVELGPAAAPPSLAQALGPRFGELSSGKRGAAAFAVERTLACGWLLCARTLAEVSDRRQTPIELRGERGAEEIWDFWAPSAHQSLESTGVHRRLAVSVRGAGAALLVADLKQLGLTRLFGALKLNQLGMRYAQAGWLLRVAQTSEIDDARFAVTIAADRADPHRPWRFDQYPVE
jgi:hypothetical protein